MRLPVPLQLCSPHLIDYSVRGGGEAVPATSLSFWAASGTQQRLRSVRLRLRPTHTATLSNATVLPHLVVAMFRSRCRSRSRRAPHASSECYSQEAFAVDRCMALLLESAFRERGWNAHKHVESTDGMLRCRRCIAVPSGHAKYRTRALAVSSAQLKHGEAHASATICK